LGWASRRAARVVYRLEPGEAGRFLLTAARVADGAIFGYYTIRRISGIMIFRRNL